MKHTPGPWKYEPTEPGSGDFDVLPEVAPSNLSWGPWIASVHGRTPDMRGFVGAVESEANARLIAAAPELLEALIELRDALADSGLKTPYGSPLMYAMLKSNRVILKAEGAA